VFFPKTAWMLGWCTPSRLPVGMETLIYWNSDIILCLDPLVIFVIMYAFVINTALYHYIVVAYMNKQIMAYM